MLNTLFRVITTRGWKSSLVYIKDLKLCVKRYTAGIPVARSEISQVRLTKDGIPAIFGKDVIDKIRSRDLESIQAVLTVLKVSDLSDYWPKPDISSI